MSSIGQPVVTTHLQGYVLLAPDGQHLVVSREVFDGFSHFLQGSKPNGNLTIHFSKGGISEVEEHTIKRLRTDRG